MTPRRAARLAWSLVAATVVLAAGAIALAVANGWARVPGQFGPSGVLAAFGLVFGAVGAVVASRRPENPIAWMFVASGLLMAFQEVGAQWGIRGAHLRTDPLPLAEIGAWIPNWIWPPITLGMASFLFLLFPTGHPPTRRWRVAGWVTGAGVGVASFALAFARGPLENFQTVVNPVGLPIDREVLDSAAGLGLAVGLLGTVLSLASLLVRLRRSTGDERAQLRWLITAAAFLVVAFAGGVAGQFESGTVSSAIAAAIIIAFLSLPVATGLAILKYRLYDIEVVISRAVVYAALAVFITIDYVGIVVGVGALVGRRGNPLLTAAAAALAALAFQPLRRRLQRFANRLVYGRRATPYEVLSEFSERVGGEYALEDVLPRMARAIGEGTGAQRSEVQLRVAGGFRPAAAWPAESGSATGDPDLVVPVTHRGDELGALAVWKARGDVVTPVEEKLVRDLASQAGLVLRNVRLTEELKANLEELRHSRRRLVTAQDVERRRLERDIHDGAQQHLVSLMVKLRVLESLARRNPEKVGAAVEDLKAQAGEALDTLRDLARGIYPPLLADQGLPAALEAQARKSPVPVDLHPDGVGRYPQEVEAAVYFCVLEALQNVAKYAGASRAALTLR
ncbi:MAG: histidine kinase, partial [Actinomycetota bacterium]